jgi:hypothetical protein
MNARKAPRSVGKRPTRIRTWGLLLRRRYPRSEELHAARLTAPGRRGAACASGRISSDVPRAYPPASTQDGTRRVPLHHTKRTRDTPARARLSVARLGNAVQCFEQRREPLAEAHEVSAEVLVFDEVPAARSAGDNPEEAEIDESPEMLV